MHKPFTSHFLPPLCTNETSTRRGRSYICLETTSSVSPPMYDCTLYLYSGDPPSPTGEGLCLHHPSPSAPPTPVSLRLGHGSALTVHRTVIHSLAAASLPGGRGLVYAASLSRQMEVSFVQTKEFAPKKGLHERVANANL